MSISAPTVTGWSNFWGNSPNSYAMQNARTYHERALARVMAKPGYRGMRALFRLMNGTAVGQTASATYARVSAPAGLTESAQLGGARVIETATAVNRATVAADRTFLNENIYDAIFDMDPAISSYPVDASGNGGGGKAGR